MSGANGRLIDLLFIELVHDLLGSGLSGLGSYEEVLQGLPPKAFCEQVKLLGPGIVLYDFRNSPLKKGNLVKLLEGYRFRSNSEKRRRVDDSR